MKILLLSICLMLTSLVFGQSEDSVVYYELYWIKTVTFKDNTTEKVRIIESDPSDSYLKRENITKRDTMGVLSYMARQVVDSLNKLRVSKGLNKIINDETYAEDEYGYAEESIFDFYGRRQTPLMVTDFYYDMGDCSCVDQVISEITSHKDIMKRVLSKRNKVINVCILIDKKTNTFYTYVQVKRLFTLSYYIGD
jgi:hypothetical protein